MFPSRRVLGIALVTMLLLSGLTASVAASRPATAVFFGISVPDNDTAMIAAAATAAGVHPTVDSIFTRLDSPSFTPGALRAIDELGMTPMVTLEPWRVGDVFGKADLRDYDAETVARGDRDAQLIHVARVIADSGVAVYLRYAHEMNGWWYPWAVGQNGNTAATYVAAWVHVARLMRAVAGPLVRLVWSPAATTGSVREQDARPAYPGDAWVDLVGMSAYGTTSDPDDAIDATYRMLTALTSRPIVICELGVAGAGKRAWLEAFGAALAERPQISGFVWNNADRSAGASGDYRFDDDAADTAAFRSSLSRLGHAPARVTSPDGAFR